jgi:hypothetical protein
MTSDFCDFCEVSDPSSCSVQVSELLCITKRDSLHRRV